LRRHGDQGLVNNDLSISYERLGNLYGELKDSAREIESYKSALRISEDLAKRQPWNTEWQRNLAIAH
jgi:hypothetical protein